MGHTLYAIYRLTAMIYTAKVSEHIHWVGVNDRSTTFFERVWPLDNGMAYNSYVIVDDKSVLVDTVHEANTLELIGRLERVLDGRSLDYIIINHMEPDHSGALPMIASRFPGVKLIGNKLTKRMIDEYYPNAAEFMEVVDGDELDLGHHKLKFVITPWVHWPETMMTLETTTMTLFSADVFGTFGALDGQIFDDEFDASAYEDEMRRYYSCIVGKYSKFAQRALAKLDGVPVKTICATHGPIWRENPAWVINKYDVWSRQEGEVGATIAVASMYGHTLALAEYIARQLVLNGVRKIKFYDVSKTDMSYIISDVWRYKGLVLGTVAYNTDMHPKMVALCHELELLGVANKHLGLFGGYSWGGGGVKGLEKFAASAKLPIVGESVDMYGGADEATLAKADALAKALAEKILQE